MIIDVVEDSEVKTGRRSEGLLVSVDNIVKKSVAGFGVFSAGLVITLAGLPERARPGSVPEEALRDLGLMYIPGVIAIYIGAMLSLAAFRLDQTSHERNLEILRDRASGPPEA
jgi:glycoside/pentoside/hexuronide:cation symporter, GPH family